ncbi:hypothetical protein LNN38_27180, partial [Pseudomonas sp. LA21]|uniref:hypothetical protein n=1 Tax=Pseudomonas sp. LA21 TaxID=2893373 RepID=UPI001FB72616
EQTCSVTVASRNIDPVQGQAREMGRILHDLASCLISKCRSLANLHGRGAVHDQKSILWNWFENRMK